MFEKRFKQGEDNYVAKERFICVTDGVGGWIRKLVDTGLFTKEFVKHIDRLHEEGSCSSLKELLDESSRLTKAKGSSTCVMAELDKVECDVLKTCNLGDSGYWLIRPKDKGQPEVLFKSKSQ